MYIVTMGTIQLNQIAANITNTVVPFLDLSDVDQSQRKSVELSRGLAAWTLMQKCDLDAQLAANAVTDGYQDNGIDAVWVNDESDHIYLVQSKWASKGTGSISLGDMHKFLQGVRDFVNAEFRKFNSKFAARQDSFESALEEVNVQIYLLVAHSGVDGLARESKHAAQTLLDEMNDPIDTVSLEYLSQAELHSLLRTSAKGKRPDLDATLHDWGSIDEPYRAFYGQVTAEEVASWYEEFDTRLLASNIRQFLGDSEVNASMRETLYDSPEHFWYLNNGITALCDGIKRAAGKATSKKLGRFRFSGVSIVNGAQTVGCIATVYKDQPEKIADARVTVRFISLEGCPPEFAQDVTRGTNTQNRVERRDFVSLDPIQERLVLDLNLSGITYAIKSGSETPDPACGFTVTDATVALACVNEDVDLSTQAKREVGRLWIGAETSDSSSQYRRLFNEGISANYLWHAVKLLRQIDASIIRERSSRQGRSNLIGVHGNRLIAHIVFRRLDREWPVMDENRFKEVFQKVQGDTARVYDALVHSSDSLYEGGYLASLFKNASKCRQLDLAVMERLAEEDD